MSTVAIIVTASLLGFIVYWIWKDRRIQSLRKILGTVAHHWRMPLFCRPAGTFEA